MFVINHEIRIDRPVEEVFRFVADSRNDPKWCPPVREVHQIEGEGPTQGAKYAFVAKPGPRQTRGAFEIVAFEPNAFAEYRGENGMVRFDYQYVFSSEDGATKLQMNSKVAPRGFWKLLQPVMRKASEKVAEEEFAILKRLLEGREPHGA